MHTLLGDKVGVEWVLVGSLGGNKLGLEETESKGLLTAQRRAVDTDHNVTPFLSLTVTLSILALVACLPPVRGVPGHGGEGVCHLVPRPRPRRAGTAHRAGQTPSLFHHQALPSTETNNVHHLTP